MKVLIVDDEAGFADLLQRFLVAKGHTVSAASDGPEALQKVHDERPELVLLDIRMPQMNGIEVLRRLRASDPGVGVIMVSGISDEETTQEALSLGALDYLTKPVSFRALADRMAQMSASAGS